VAWNFGQRPKGQKHARVLIAALITGRATTGFKTNNKGAFTESEYMKTQCVRCSQNGSSCCKGTQICLTNGDILRISRFLDACNFFTIENADPAYMEFGDDPGWLTLTIRPDGKRCVLRRTMDKSCTLLGENGCILPVNVRPLVCRLHPYLYTEAGISGVDPSCPISRQRSWPAVLDQMGMAMHKACKWHALLYCELKGAKPSGSEKDDGWRQPELERLSV